MPKKALLLTVAVGVVVNSDNQILIAQRPAHVSHSGLWEFPGGKLEAEEDSYSALCRELYEEVGIEVVKAQHWCEVFHQYENSTVHLTNWLVTQFKGEPYGCEGQIVKWESPQALVNYTFPKANEPVIKKIISNFV